MVHNVLANPNIEQPFYTIIAELLSKANNCNVHAVARICMYICISITLACARGSYVSVLISVNACAICPDVSVDSALHLAQQ